MYTKKMLNKLISNILKNSVFSGMLLVSVGSVISTFFSYYFNFYIQSIFPSFVDYSNFTFIITFITISQLIPLAISGSLSIIVTELKVKNEFKILTMLYLKMVLMFSLIGLIMCLLVLVLSNQISVVFKIDNIYLIQLLAVSLFFSTASIPVSSFLYGLLRFKAHVSLTVFSAAAKLGIVYLLYTLNYGFLSIPYGIILTTLAAFTLGNIFLMVNFNHDFKGTSTSGLVKRVILFSLPLFFIVTGNGMLTQVDFLVIKSKFAGDLAGQYALLINIGKMLFFSSMIFLGAMSPQVTEAYNKRDGYFKVFFFYLKIVSLVVIAGLLVLGLFPVKFLDLFVALSSFIGLNLTSLNLYYSISNLIPLYAIFICLVILINFLVIFLVASSTTRIYISFILGLVTQIGLIEYFSYDLTSAIFCNIIAASILLFYLVFETYKKYESFHNSSSL